MKVFDIQMQVLLCPKHKKFFEDMVLVKLTKTTGINPTALVNLLQETEECLDCCWSTIFGKQWKLK